eukprot:gnl/TRDRNA2_/TRDRNA2_182830_c0_seq1.p1 gnl/TRDRNA2_/TRDRNA2_182830_c0~~gnl/TRDRNA2_/TRDRNA2_182830_c0_seq1.p1  ORF type:complete len:250 (-),score=34.09 gnl/TRDRNA2_/TRDRNA2_182830_c0_seq1:73-822(-)
MQAAYATAADPETQPINEVRYLSKNVSQEIRIGFVRKVYAIFSLQLLVTVAIAAPIQTFSEKWMNHNRWLLYLSIGLSFASLLSMVCCRDMARSFPTNYLLLFIFTACQAVMVGVVSAQYTWQSVLLAAGITVGIFLGLTAYAWLTKTDFTGMGPYIFGALLAFCVFGLVLGIMSMCGTHIKWLMVLYDICGVLLFTFFIIFDTQRILGEWGGHKEQFCIDDYCLAALQLYMDLLNLFLHILALLGDRK